ncbi:MAG: S9 family peptidase [Bacteroidales bacterium]|nr:S9 family peptidase [Bacteroidales bacterium]
MNRSSRILLSAVTLLTAALSMQAQPELTLEDIYAKGTFRMRGVPQPTWMEDGRSYSAMTGEGLVRIDAATLAETVVVPMSAFIPEGADRPVRAEDYTWSEDKTKLVVYTNSRRVWRRNTRGDYWLLDIAAGTIRQLGQGLEPSRMMYGKLSPKGDKFAYVYYNNLYVEDIATGERRQLTRDGSEVIVNGNFDWVYEEELNCYDGWRWSPDGKKIAFWRSDTEGTGTFLMIDNIDSLYSFTIPLPYPKAGTTNSAVKVGVVDVETAETGWFPVPGDPRENYIARMEFVPGTEEVMIQQLNRLQNTNTVYYGNVNTLELNPFYQDHDDAFLDIHDNIVWLDGNKYFTWTSEKDGWRHLYRVSRDGKKETLITKGEFDVIRILQIDTKGGYVYYMASPESAVEQYLYRSRLDGKKAAERVTPMGFNGTYSYNISPGAKYALCSYSNCATPRVYEMVSLPDHKVIRTLEDNEALKAVYASYGFRTREYFQVDIGEVVLDGWMIKPRDFDPAKKYPVIFNIYGEPASSTVQNSWSGDYWNQLLAQNGYIVMSIDPRGTNNPKGREWRKSIYGKVGILAMADHAKAVRLAEGMFPFMDPERIGVWGWSGGGSSTAHLMFKYPDIYSTGIAVAGVYSQYLYDSIYQERYMGLPSTNPDGFREGSPINHAAGLKGDLLLIHGTGDDNVHYQSLEMLVNELVKQDKQFSMMAYPMRTHGISERENTTMHLYRTMLRFWLEHLPAGGR